MNTRPLLIRLLLVLLAFTTPLQVTGAPTTDPLPALLKGVPLKGGEPRRVRIGEIQPPPQPVKSDRWQSLEDGGHRWSADIRSPGAKGLRLALLAPALPPGAAITLSESVHGKRHVYTREDMAAEMAQTRLFWSRTLFAEEVTVEAYLPPGHDPAGFTIRVAKIAHLFRPPREAGSCNLDATCYPGWSEQAAGVVRLIIPSGDGAYACSGALLANGEPATRRPYLLTANHCMETEDEADGVEVFWNYQSSQCDGLPELGESTLGAELHYADRGLDFVLMESRVEPPEGSVYVEWSASPPLSGDPVTTIHHPDGSHKRISFGRLTGVEGGLLEVVWDEGTTEPGSSGAPMFNQQGQLIGHLMGGWASCQMPDGLDQYQGFSELHPILRTLLEPGRDLHGDLPGSASPVALTSRVSGRINEAGDADYFRIELSEAGRLILYSEGESDTVGRLYREGGVLVTQDEDAGDATNFYISHQVEAGSYYLRVSHSDFSSGTGDYVLSVGLDRHGDTSAEATVVAPVSETEGSLFPAGDEDYFLIEVSEESFLTLYTEGATDTFGYLLDADGNEIVRNDDEADGVSSFRIVQRVEPGNYFLRVRHYHRDSGMGEYRLVVETGADPADADLQGDDLASAAPLALATPVEAAIDPAGDIDVFRIEITEIGTLSVGSSGSTDTRANLRDEQGNLLAENDDQDSFNLNFRISGQLDPGVYFVEVFHYDVDNGTGGYSIEATFTPGTAGADDHGDLLSTATPVALYARTAGTLAVGDRDLFRFELPWSARVTIASHGSTDTVGSLLDADGETLASSDDEGRGLNFLIDSELAAGSYYVSVTGYGGAAEGDYELSVGPVSDPLTFDWRDGRLTLPLIAAYLRDGEPRWLEGELVWAAEEGGEALFDLARWDWVESPTAAASGSYRAATGLLELPSVNVTVPFGDDEIGYGMTLRMVEQGPPIRFTLDRVETRE